MAKHTLGKKNWAPTIAMGLVAIVWGVHASRQPLLSESDAARIEGAELVATPAGFDRAKSQVAALEARLDKAHWMPQEEGLVWAFWCVVREAGRNPSDNQIITIGQRCVAELKANNGILPK